MKARKSSTEWVDDNSYPAVMQKLCTEEDVIVIPQFVSHHEGQVSSSKLKERKPVGENASIIEHSKEEVGPCESLEPPEVEVVYNEENQPVAIICKNMYLEYSFVHAIGKSLPFFPTITTLKIENCCISKEVAEALSYILSEESGKGITELSLNGNENIEEILPLFISLPTGLKYLSLQNCGLDDEAIRLLSKDLEYSDKHQNTIQVLDLSLNQIGDKGAQHLANALRTNRTLVSLSLLGNRIGPEGASSLAEVLREFKLTHEEVMLRRRKIFDKILLKKQLVEKEVEKLKSEKQSTKSVVKPGERVRRIRGPDGRVRCYSSKDRRGKASKEAEEAPGGPDPSPSELLAIEQQVESEMVPDKHPFVDEVTKGSNGFWCNGCWSLGNLNLSYNHLTQENYDEFDEVLKYHFEKFHPKMMGLARLVLRPEDISSHSVRENSVDSAGDRKKSDQESNREDTNRMKVTKPQDRGDRGSVGTTAPGTAPVFEPDKFAPKSFQIKT